MWEIIQIISIFEARERYEANKSTKQQQRLWLYNVR